MVELYDVIVIGGGRRAKNVAGRCAAGGLSVVLVEHELVGGECSYWGCIPSKTLLRPGDAVAATRRVPGAVEALRGSGTTRGSDVAPRRRRDLRARPRTARGRARRRGRWCGHAASSGSAARAVIVATGTAAVMPDVAGLQEAMAWDNRAATEARRLPKRLLVLGGGAVGAELAQAYKRLGSDVVTIIESGPRLLAREEPFAGDEVGAAFADEGIDVVTNARGRRGSPTRAALARGPAVPDGERGLAAASRGIRPLTEGSNSSAQRAKVKRDVTVAGLTSPSLRTSTWEECMKPSWRRLLGLLVVMSALVLAVVGCGGDDEAAGEGTTSADTADVTSDKPTIVIGTKNFPEQFILGELYAQALEAKGYDVTLKSNIGSTEIIDKALTSGKIDLYPEYTGTALTVVFGAQGSAESAEATYEAAKEKYEARGQTLFAMTPFSDSDAIAVRKSTAEENGLTSVGDLKTLGTFKLGGQPEFRTRAQGLPGLRRNYGLTNVKFVPFAGISPYEALDQEKVDAAAIFSTDPPLGTGKYVVLEDPEAQFGFQNVAPVVDRELADRGGDELRETIDAVSEMLTDEAIIAMNKAVVLDQRPAKEVAREFLEANQLT